MLEVIWTTFRLATVTTVLLILVATPVAWALARRRTWWKDILGAVLSWRPRAHLWPCCTRLASGLWPSPSPA